MLLFAYHTGPAHVFLGESEGTIYAIAEDGSVTRKCYIFGQEDQAQETCLGHCGDQLGTIRETLRTFQEAHGQMSRDLYNGSLDGAFNEFTILGKKIIAWNITRTDLRQMMQDNRTYYDRYKKNMIAENALLDLACDIAASLDGCAPEMAQALRAIEAL